jgi:hypothetical protein
MKIIEPLNTVDATLTSTNVPETDHAEWLIGTSYSIDDNVIVTTPDVHKIYIALTATTGDYPPDNPVDWEEVSATNAWKMFDQKTRSVTTATSPIIVEITPGLLFNAVSLFDILADSVNVTVTDPTDGEVYNHDVDMLDLFGIDDYYSWFFSPLSNISSVTLVDLPAYPLATMKVTVDNGASPAELGELVVGSLKTIGVTVYGTKIGIEDYSTKHVDNNGIATLIPGKYANIVDYKIQIISSRASYINNILSSYRATPVVYIGNENVQETIIFGFFKDFRIVLENKNISSCTLSVEELA